MAIAPFQEDDGACVRFLIWFLGEVVVPLLGPVVLAMMFIGLWSTGASGFTPDYGIVLDNLSPWVLTVYALTLIGSTFNDLGSKMGQNVLLVCSLATVALVVGVYAAFIAVWQHDSRWSPDAYVYTVSAVLLLVSIALSYLGHHLSKQS